MIETTKDERGKLIYECPGIYPNQDETIRYDRNRIKAKKSIIQQNHHRKNKWVVLARFDIMIDENKFCTSKCSYNLLEIIITAQNDLIMYFNAWNLGSNSLISLLRQPPDSHSSIYMFHFLAVLGAKQLGCLGNVFAGARSQTYWRGWEAGSDGRDFSWFADGMAG